MHMCPVCPAEEWISGQNKDPVLMSMDPKNNNSKQSNAAQFSKKTNLGDLASENEELKRKNSQLSGENAELRARVRELEAQLGITNPESTKEESATEEANLEEPQTENQINEEETHEEQPREHSQSDDEKE